MSTSIKTSEASSWTPGQEDNSGKYTAGQGVASDKGDSGDVLNDSVNYDNYVTVVKVVTVEWRMWTISNKK